MGGCQCDNGVVVNDNKVVVDDNVVIICVIPEPVDLVVTP